MGVTFQEDPQLVTLVIMSGSGPDTKKYTKSCYAPSLAKAILFAEEGLNSDEYVCMAGFSDLLGDR